MMEFKKLSDAKNENLIRLSHWLKNNEENQKELLSRKNQVMLDPKRKTMFVRDEKLIALFVDNRAKDEKDGPRKRKISKTGRYKSIRNLAECLFSENPDLPLETFKTRMQEEYPGSAPAGDKVYGHWCWYRHKLVIQKEYKTIPMPENGKCTKSK